MREIKFRLRDRNNRIVGYEKWYLGIWHNDGYWVAKPQWLYSPDNKYWTPKYIEHRWKDQYTGLKDKNGKEIYEGDFLKYKDAVMQVEWDQGAFWVDEHIDHYHGLLGDEYFDEIEIIGNIWENPELLNQ